MPAPSVEAALEPLRRALAAMADRQDLLERSQAAGPPQPARPALDALRAQLTAQTARAASAEGKLAALGERFTALDARLGGVERGRRARAGPRGAERGLTSWSAKSASCGRRWRGWAGAWRGDRAGPGAAGAGEGAGGRGRRGGVDGAAGGGGDGVGARRPAEGARRRGPLCLVGRRCSTLG